MPETICAFGCFDLEGARSWVIRQGLIDSGHRITYCRTEAHGLLQKIRDLRMQWKKLEASTDAIYVVFLGHYIVPLAWWCARRKRIPVIFDAFISLYDTEVYDRKRLSRWHPRAWLLWFVDWLACTLADVTLVDTEEHKQYFIEQYHVRPERILVLPIGCRTDIFRPLPRAEKIDEWIVLFHGTFIQLQGIETILRAAQELSREPVIFEIIGKGQTEPAMRSLAGELDLTNIRFLGTLPMEELPLHIANAAVCLGIFGTTPKALRVVPTKAYEIFRCGRPLITEDSPAAHRVLRNRAHALLVPPGNPHALAEAIRELHANPPLAAAIAENGLRLSLEKWEPKTIVTPLVHWLHATTHG